MNDLQDDERTQPSSCDDRYLVDYQEFISVLIDRFIEEQRAAIADLPLVDVVNRQQRTSVLLPTVSAHHS